MDAGLLSGIANGIQSGIQGYQTERNYQQSKYMQAQELALKKRLADIDAGKVVTEGVTAGGTPFAQALSNRLLSPGQSDASTPDSQSQSSASSGNGLLIPPGLLSGWDRQKFMKDYDTNEKSFETGVQVKGHDPETGLPQFADAPLSKVAQAALDQKNAETKNAKLKPTLDLHNEFAAEPTNKQAAEASFAYNKMLSAYNHPSPEGDKTLVISQAQLENPNGVPREATLEDLRSVPGLSARTKNAIEQAINGQLSDETRDDMMRLASHTVKKNLDAYNDTKQNYLERAKGLGINPKTFSAPNIDKTYSTADSMIGRLGDYQKFTDRKGLIPELAAKVQGLLGRPTSMASEPATDTGKGPTPAERKVLMDHLVQNPNDLRNAQIKKLLEQ